MLLRSSRMRDKSLSNGFGIRMWLSQRTHEPLRVAMGALSRPGWGRTLMLVSSRDGTSNRPDLPARPRAYAGASADSAAAKTGVWSAGAGHKRGRGLIAAGAAWVTLGKAAQSANRSCSPEGFRASYCRATVVHGLDACNQRGTDGACVSAGESARCSIPQDSARRSGPQHGSNEKWVTPGTA